MKLTEKELNEFPIGTMLLYDKGYLIKTDCKEKQKNWYQIGDDGDNGWYGEGAISKQNIESIEIPKQWDKYIPPKPILDDKEKEYLSAVIKPFRNKIANIYKTGYNKVHEFIAINIPEDSDIAFPNFEVGTMYKGMELDRKYSLDELGL